MAADFAEIGGVAGTGGTTFFAGLVIDGDAFLAFEDAFMDTLDAASAVFGGFTAGTEVNACTERVCESLLLEVVIFDPVDFVLRTVGSEVFDWEDFFDGGVSAKRSVPDFTGVFAKTFSLATTGSLPGAVFFASTGLRKSTGFAVEVADGLSTVFAIAEGFNAAFLGCCPAAAFGFSRFVSPFFETLAAAAFFDLSVGFAAVGVFGSTAEGLTFVFGVARGAILFGLVATVFRLALAFGFAVAFSFAVAAGVGLTAFGRLAGDSVDASFFFIACQSS